MEVFRYLLCTDASAAAMIWRYSVVPGAAVASMSDWGTGTIAAEFGAVAPILEACCTLNTPGWLPIMVPDGWLLR